MLLVRVQQWEELFHLLFLFMKSPMILTALLYLKDKRAKLLLKFIREHTPQEPTNKSLRPTEFTKSVGEFPGPAPCMQPDVSVKRHPDPQPHGANISDLDVHRHGINRLRS